MLIIKFTWKVRVPELPQQSWIKGRNKAGGLTFPNFRICSKATLMQIMYYWHEERHID
jgi:hypothetical protein